MLAGPHTVVAQYCLRFILRQKPTGRSSRKHNRPGCARDEREYLRLKPSVGGRHTAGNKRPIGDTGSVKKWFLGRYGSSKFFDAFFAEIQVIARVSANRFEFPHSSDNPSGISVFAPQERSRGSGTRLSALKRKRKPLPNTHRMERLLFTTLGLSGRTGSFG